MVSDIFVYFQFVHLFSSLIQVQTQYICMYKELFKKKKQLPTGGQCLHVCAGLVGYALLDIKESS